MLSPATEDPAALSDPGTEKCSVHQQPLVGRSVRPVSARPHQPQDTQSSQPTLAVLSISAWHGSARHQDPQKPRSNPHGWAEPDLAGLG